MRCHDKENLLWQSTVAIKSDPLGSGTINMKEAVFNPRPNDTNLEFDPNRNLYEGRADRGMKP